MNTQITRTLSSVPHKKFSYAIGDATLNFTLSPDPGSVERFRSILEVALADVEEYKVAVENP